MYTITFYSFKGGVGRTMALVNVAAELVRRGRRVLVVDFDLEAPGLETYKQLGPDKRLYPKGHPGIVEYVTQFRQTYQVPDLREFVYEAKPIGKKGGRLWVMPAGRRDTAYRRALVDLDWKDLYKNRHGFLLFEDTKKGWEEQFKPDYVLIDSRTGDTDVLGICTRQLPDAVVLMFTPNEQNLVGLKNVCRDIRREESEGLKKTIRLHFVATNVPDLDDEDRILRRQMQTFRKRLSFSHLSGVIRRYENLDLLNQRVFTLDRPHSKLARSYRTLVRTLLKDNLADRDGAMIFLEDYPERIKNRVPGEKGVFSNNDSLPFTVGKTKVATDPLIGPAHAPPVASPTPADMRRGVWMQYDGNTATSHVMVGLSDGRSGFCIACWEDKQSLHQIAVSFNNDAEILNKVAACFMLEDDYRSAVRVLNRVLQVEPNRADSLLERAHCKTNLVDVDGAAEDLLACLRLPKPLDDLSFKYPFFKSSCLTKLRTIAPEKLFEVADLLEKGSVPGVDPLVVASFLCDMEEGAARGVRLLREAKGAVPVQTLLKARCWKEIIQLHESRGLEDRDPGSMLQLALAQWGEDGEMPESLCRRALETLESDGQALSFHPWGLQGIALLLWRTGNVDDAIECLAKAEQRARAETDDSAENELFSLWRLRSVSIGQYLDDCTLLRRMFKGEPLRPAFLGPVSPATAV